MPGFKPTLSEFSAGTLRSGSKSGPVVKSRKQAIAIGLSEARKAGEKVPPPRASPPLAVAQSPKSKAKTAAISAALGKPPKAFR